MKRLDEDGYPIRREFLLEAMIIALALIVCAGVWYSDNQNVFEYQLRAGERWYVKLPESTKVYDVYVSDMTNETTELILADETVLRFETTDIEALEPVGLEVGVEQRNYTDEVTFERKELKND